MSPMSARSGGGGRQPGPDEGTVLDALVAALTEAGTYNRNDQVAPAAVLWPDKERHWASLIPRLRERLPLLTLGDYDPGTRSGPSYWLRCAIAGTVPVDMPDGVPIIWMPGVSRPDIRANEDCPVLLQPLAELQYRGVVWTQRNGKDWTPYAFLVSNDALGIDVAGDAATRAALGHALAVLANERVERLRREAPLSAAFFEALLTPDPSKAVLDWLNDPNGYQAQRTSEEWSAFCSLCSRQYRFDPETDGPITAAEMLGTREGPWAVVWDRFAAVPMDWPNVPDQLRAARPTKPVALFDDAVEETWPQDNEEAERRLREALVALDNVTASQARSTVLELEATHGSRRSWVWARLGLSPLARALEHLAVLAKVTERPLTGATVTAVAESWTEWGWQADDAVLRALAAAERARDQEAVATAIIALYRPWLERAALCFQDAVRDHPEDWRRAEPVAADPGTCLLFTDALRFDAARRLVEPLESRGFRVSLNWRLAPLPGVTPTAKPAIAPVADRLRGSSGFDTTITDGGSRLPAEGLRRLLADAGYQVLTPGSTGDPSGRGWTELGRIDSYGHEHGVRLACHLEGELRDIVDRVEALLDAGWEQVIVITDHGWLLMPGGLPKTDLPQHLTELRKGRCARIKPFELVDAQTVPWHWDENVRVAVPRGIACYEAGKEYEHGGLSPQECVVPIMTVRRERASETEPVTIENITWRRLRCVVTVNGAAVGLTVDIRSRPADPRSSLVIEPKEIGPDGRVSLAAQPDHEGDAAVVVVLGPDGGIRAQQFTTVGG